jgi:hypothetical protein
MFVVDWEIEGWYLEHREHIKAFTTMSSMDRDACGLIEVFTEDDYGVECWAGIKSCFEGGSRFISY